MALAAEGLPHDIIAPKAVVKTIVNAHMDEYGRNYYNPAAHWKIASVDTMPGRAAELSRWIRSVTFGFTDEAHHVLASNKWGRECNRFDNARWMLPTATPERADGKGLGRDYDGIADKIIEGPPMRWLINNGYLTDYIIRAPLPADLDLRDVEVSASGEYKLEFHSPLSRLMRMEEVTSTEQWVASMVPYAGRSGARQGQAVELLDKARYGLATRMLTTTGHSLSEITYLLGYSEESAFIRAFRRWMGCTPLDYRRSMRNPATQGG